jgi:hypothetical protein
MPVLDESHDERVLRILRDAKECLTAKQVTDILHGELGGGVSFTKLLLKLVSLNSARSARVAAIHTTSKM